jgi:4-amino-4-deoxy-L-arabinose transferase-like glycosyltransferase
MDAAPAAPLDGFDSPLPTRRESWIAGCILLALVCAQGILILEGLGLGRQPLVLHDYQVYHRMAVNLLDRRTLSMDAQEPFAPTMFRPPGYPMYLAMVYTAFGRHPLAVRWSQLILHAATCWLLYATLRRWRPHRPALAAAIVAACYPPLVFMATLYVGHTLSAFLWALVVFGLTWMGSPRARAVAVAFFLGLLVGLVALVRPAFQGLAPPIALALLFWERRGSRRVRVLQGFALGMGVLVVLAPWVGRNYALTRGQSGAKLMVGGWAVWASALQYNGKLSYRMLRPEWLALIDEFNARNRDAENLFPAHGPEDRSFLLRRELWVERSFDESAREELRLVRPTMVLESLVVRPFWLWSTADASPWPLGALHRATQALHISIATLVVLGLVKTRHNLLVLWPLWILGAYQTALHFVYHVEPRFTIEARVFMIGFIAFLISARGKER